MIIISHRGASAYAPENSIESFKKALELNSVYFEFDVHRTKDNVLIVHHDYDFKKTAQIDKKIKDSTYAEIKKVNIAKHFSNDLITNAPTLKEVLDLLKDKAKLINIEIKNDNNIYPNIEKDILDYVKTDEKLFSKILFSSFDFNTLKKLRKISKEAKIAFLGHKLSTILLFPAIIKAKSIFCENFHLSRKISFKWNLKIIKFFNFKIFIYTVNNKEEALKFKKYNVDGIFSNYPDLLEKK